MVSVKATKTTAGASNGGAPGRNRGAGRVTPDADLTWLLHKAAQRMRVVMEQRAEAEGADLRGYLLLTALHTLGPQTQLALAQSIGLDKSTLTVVIDRLERSGLVVRRADPKDRRARLPEATAAGRELQSKIARSLARSEASLLESFGPTGQRSLRSMLCELIGSEDDAAAGSCF